MKIDPQYILHLADNNLILGQRLGEWCGHGPVLEQDIALTNIALDLIGQARLLYQYAAETIGDTHEDALAFVRLEHEYRNVLLVEQPNDNFGETVVRQFFYDTFNYLNFDALRQCKDAHLSAIAEKGLKEITYHRRWSGEWVIRLGDGTEESHEKVQAAVDHLWQYTGELFLPDPVEQEMYEQMSTPDVASLYAAWKAYVTGILETATITIPSKDTWMQSGGKSGRHSEHLGFILSELQYMQRTYPAMQW